MAELDVENNNWRAKAAGVPTIWFRRGKYLWVDRKIDSAADDLVVYSALSSDAWTLDVAPYNALSHLEPFHPAMVLYLKKRAKAKVGKPEEAAAAHQEYSLYLEWAKKELGGTRFGAIHFTPRVSLRGRR